VGDHPANDILFEKQLKWVFDHPVREPAWYWDEHDDWWQGFAASMMVEFMTRLFEAPTTYLQSFSDAQVNQGLWFLTGDACLDSLACLLDESVAWPQRERCVHSIRGLFANYVAVRCSPHLGHTGESGANPLNGACYMWWDQLHTTDDLENPSSRTMNAEIVAVMSQTLEIAHDACRESALHGLGHWQRYCPDKVPGIIDNFLTNNPTLRPELRTYAIKARVGRVL
jgi:hypothetical protein